MRRITQVARDLSPELGEKIQHICKRAYRALSFSGYARIDMRLTPESDVYILECNPNPNLGFGDDFADSADKAGLPYARLIEKILTLGLRHHSTTVTEAE